jgi:hypothetical protein
MIPALAVLLLLAAAQVPSAAATPALPPDATPPASSTPPTASTPSSAPEPELPGPAPTAGAEPATAAEALRYPLGQLAVPDFVAPGDPFTLTDLRYGLDSQDSATTHDFAARVRYRNWGYFGAEARGERRGLSLMTHRLALSAADEKGRWDLAGAFRTARLLFAANAGWRGSGDHSWVLEPSLSFRVTSDFELEAWTVADTQRPGDRLVTELGGDVSWQYDSRLAAFAEFVRNYELIAVGVEGRRDENRRDTGLLVAVAQLGPAELTSQVSLEDVSGRFPRRNTDASLLARVALGPRLLLEGNGRDRFDNGAGELVREWGGALTWFGRRVTLPRAGRSAERAVALARSATRLGEYELFAFDPEALREQRQRLALSPQREELREQMTELYRAEVEERQLPLLGVGYRDSFDTLSAEKVRAARVFVGMPWPPALPWRAGERSVRFLELAYEHQWHTTAGASSTPQHSGSDLVTLTAALNRELDFVVGWSHAAPTALDIIHGVTEHEGFTASFVYARGR